MIRSYHHMRHMVNIFHHVGPVHEIVVEGVGLNQFRVTERMFGAALDRKVDINPEPVDETPPWAAE